MVEVLDARTDRHRWISLWEATGREPFAHPGYCEAVASESDTAVALVVEYEDGRALVPLITRFVTPAKGRMALRDCVSPYGYGGPFFTGEARMDVVLRRLQQWLSDEAFACAFLRLSIGVSIEPGEVAPGCQVIATSENVVVDLARSEEQQWRHYAHKVRKNVNKARRLGCCVAVDQGFDAIESFMTVYQETMTRRSADEWFHFSKDFYHKLRSELPNNIVLFSVLDAAGTTVSTELVLQSDRRLYSFLGGTLQSAFPMAPNDLLKHTIINYGRASGYHEYVLGGGLKPEDGIFRFKLGFDPYGIQPYLTARVIGDSAMYSAATGAVSLRDAYEDLTAEYFPQFRVSEPHE